MLGRRLLAKIFGPRAQRIDNHRTIRRVGRDAYRYCDGDHCVTVDVEMLVDDPSDVIYAGSIRRWSGRYTDPIDETRRREIAQTIQMYLNRQGHTAVIDWTPYSAP